MPKNGRDGYKTLAFLGLLTQGGKIRRGYFTPTCLGAHMWAEGLHNPCLLRGPQKGGTKSEVATSLLPSRGPTHGWKAYIAHASFGVPSTGTKITLKSGPLEQKSGS